MNAIKIAAVAIAVAATGLASQANATVFTYDLTDTPHGKYGDGGFYEFTGGDPRFDTYSFESNGADVKLRYDDAANTAQINGLGYNLNTGDLAEFNLFYNDVALNGSTLSLADTDAVGSVGGTTIFGKGFNFELLNDALTGHGWLTNADGSHFGDFHLAGTQIANGGCVGVGCGEGEVPVPAPLTLIGAMALFGAWRRRRSTEG